MQSGRRRHNGGNRGWLGGRGGGRRLIYGGDRTPLVGEGDALGMIFALLPQHVWEVGAGVMAVTLAGQGILLLTRGHTAGEEEMNKSTIRAAAIALLVGGLGVGLAALLVDAESRSARSSDGWGGVGGVVGLAVWLVLVVASTSIATRKKR